MSLRGPTVFYGPRFRSRRVGWVRTWGLPPLTRGRVGQSYYSLGGRHVLLEVQQEPPPVVTPLHLGVSPEVTAVLPLQQPAVPVPHGPGTVDSPGTRRAARVGWYREQRGPRLPRLRLTLPMSLVTYQQTIDGLGPDTLKDMNFTGHTRLSPHKVSGLLLSGSYDPLVSPVGFLPLVPTPEGLQYRR